MWKHSSHLSEQLRNNNKRKILNRHKSCSWTWFPFQITSLDESNPLKSGTFDQYLLFCELKLLSCVQFYVDLTEFTSVLKTVGLTFHRLTLKHDKKCIQLFLFMNCGPLCIIIISLMSISQFFTFNNLDCSTKFSPKTKICIPSCDISKLKKNRIIIIKNTIK